MADYHPSMSSTKLLFSAPCVLFRIYARVRCATKLIVGEINVFQCGEQYSSVFTNNSTEDEKADVELDMTTFENATVMSSRPNCCCWSSKYDDDGSVCETSAVFCVEFQSRKLVLEFHKMVTEVLRECSDNNNN